VLLEGLVPRELTQVGSPLLARAWALPGEGEVTRAVVHAHTGCFEKLEAGTYAAIQVLLCEPRPAALRCKLVLGLTSCCFFFIVINHRGIRWLAGRK